LIILIELGAIFAKVGEVAKVIGDIVNKIPKLPFPGTPEVPKAPWLELPFEIFKRRAVSVEDDDVEASDVIEVNNAFAEYVTNVSKNANQLEDSVIKECEILLNQILEQFKEVNEELNLFNVNNVRRKFDRTIRNLKGTFAQEVSSVVSLANPECVEILKMIPCNEKDARLEKLKNTAFKNSIDSICVTIQDTTDEFMDDITYAIQTRIQSIEDSSKQYLDRLDALNESLESGDSEEVICTSEYNVSLYMHYVALLNSMEDSILINS
jgi:hypothetical protein